MMESFQAAFSDMLLWGTRERLISEQLWGAFMNRLSEAQLKGEITKEDISVILAADETEKSLSSNKENVIDEIVNPDYIGKLKTEHSELIEQNGIREQKIQDLEKQVRVSKGETEKEFRARLNSEERANKMTSSIEKYAHNVAAIIINICALLIWLILCIGVYLLLNMFGLDIIANALAILLFVGGNLFSFMGKRVDLARRISSLRNKMIEEFEDRITALAMRQLVPNKTID